MEMDLQSVKVKPKWWIKSLEQQIFNIVLYIFFIVDIQQVLSHLVTDTDVQRRLFPPASHGPSHTHTHAQNVTDPWSDIPEDVVDKIRTVYALDFQLFGYDPYRIKGKPRR